MTPRKCTDCEQYDAQQNLIFCAAGYLQQPRPEREPFVWHCPHWTPPALATLARRATTPPEPPPTAADRAREALKAEGTLI